MKDSYTKAEVRAAILAGEKVFIKEMDSGQTAVNRIMAELNKPKYHDDFDKDRDSCDDIDRACDWNHEHRNDEPHVGRRDAFGCPFQRLLSCGFSIGVTYDTGRTSERHGNTV